MSACQRATLVVLAFASVATAAVFGQTSSGTATARDGVYNAEQAIKGRTAFDDLKFPTRPLYTGRPWFLPALVGWYRWRDAMEVRRARRE